MKRYPILNNVHKFLERVQITHEYQKEMQNKGYDLENEYILFEKKGIGHIAIMMTNHEQYELVSYNERTGEYQAMFGHCEEFIDEIMNDYELTGRLYK